MAALAEHNIGAVVVVAAADGDAIVVVAAADEDVVVAAGEHIVHTGLVVALDSSTAGAAVAAAPHCEEVADNSALDVTFLSSCWLRLCVLNPSMLINRCCW